MPTTITQLPLKTSEKVQLYRLEPAGVASPNDWAMLSEQETIRARRMRDPNSREEWVQSKAEWRRILGRCTGIHGTELQIHYSEFGAPIVRPFIHQNLTHTRGLTLIATSDSKIGPVGVDVEAVRQLSVMDLSRAACTEDEIDYLANIEEAERLKDFLHMWVRKEALVKAMGFGLHFPIERLNTRKCQVNTSGIATYNTPVGRFLLEDLDLGSAYVGAVAVLLP